MLCRGTAVHTALPQLRYVLRTDGFALALPCLHCERQQTEMAPIDIWVLDRLRLGS